MARVGTKTIVQCVIVLAVFFWLLYQIQQSLRITEGLQNDIDERIGEIFGRKGGLRNSNHTVEEVLDGDDGDEEEEDHNEDTTVRNGADLSDVQETYAEEYVVNKPQEDKEEMSSERLNDDGKGLKKRSFAEFRPEGKVGGKKADVSTVKRGQKVKSVSRRKKGVKVGEENRTEVGSLVNVGAVILKSVAKQWEVIQFDDETGVSKHDSAPSRRSNIQAQSLHEENVSSSGSDSSKDSEARQKLRVQNITDKLSLRPSEVESGKESRREILQEER